jgi:hypothetical protein
MGILLMNVLHRERDMDEVLDNSEDTTLLWQSCDYASYARVEIISVRAMKAIYNGS